MQGSAGAGAGRRMVRAPWARGDGCQRAGIWRRRSGAAAVAGGHWHRRHGAGRHERRRTMKLSAFFPTRDIGNDPAKIRDWAQAAEELGYARIEVPDHVLGAGTATRPDWKPTYAYTDPFHETFVTLGFPHACTQPIGQIGRPPSRERVCQYV